MPVINSLENLKEEAATWRRELHQNPQTAYEEKFASSLVKKKLTEWGIPFRDNVAVTGVIATIEGQKTTSGKSLALRADMDALNIEEKSGVTHASKYPGKMHACGHDGHTATLLATAKYLQETRNFNGKVHLIFQPAEEGARGAHRMIEEGLFRDFPSDYVFGLHNWPWTRYGQIETRIGPLLASVDEFEIVIKGKGGHAAFPHETIDPLISANHLISAFQTIISRNVDPVETAVISITNLHAGTGARNVIGDTVKMDGTVRTFSQDIRELIETRIKTICESTEKAFGTTIELNYMLGIDPTVNSKDGVEMAAKAAAKIVGDENVNTDCPPCMGGEDFGAYLNEKPGAFILVGQGVQDEKSPHNHGLHSPYFDFNDDIIPIGASYFATLVAQYMPLDTPPDTQLED